jgi:hypothetical protein
MAALDSGSVSTILDFAWIAFFMAFFLYGARIQSTLMVLQIRSKLRKLEQMETTAKDKLFTQLKKLNPQPDGIGEGVERALNSFMIYPISLDPKGIVPKLGKIADTYDRSLKSSVKALAPKANDVELMNLTNLTEVSIGLNNMYRVVRHYYLLGKKPGGLLALAQLQLVLPSIMDAAEAYHSSIEAFIQGKPIGDGFGPLVVSELKEGLQYGEIVEDTVVAETIIEERKVFVVKAKGPGGNVGKPGEAIQKIFDTNTNVKLLVTVDAALKLEGEETGQVAEGIGAAIGGLGVERYQMEEAASKTSAPLYAIVVKMSEKEAITHMPQTVIKAASDVRSRVIRVIKDRTKPGDTIIVAGIGNTIGVP